MKRTSLLQIVYNCFLLLKKSNGVGTLLTTFDLPVAVAGRVLTVRVGAVRGAARAPVIFRPVIASRNVQKP